MPSVEPHSWSWFTDVKSTPVLCPSHFFDGEPDRIRLKVLYKPLAMRGSIASRRPSPSRLTASTVTDRNAAGKNTMEGFTCHSALPSAMMLPQDGMVGRGPPAMKDRIGSTSLALAPP